MNSTEITKVAIFRTRNGEEPILKEVIENVTSVEVNEHCIVVNSIARKGKRPFPNKQVFSKPEFCMTAIAPSLVDEAGEA